MERMITDRLAHYLESRDMIANYQSGFRIIRNTMDAIMMLKTEVRKAQ